MIDDSGIRSAIEEGDPRAAERLLPLVYDELRKLAAHRLAQEKPGQTLQATALVHEAYLRVVGPDGADRSWDGRGHFFAAAAEAMRRILVENARKKGRARHGGLAARHSIDLDALADQVPERDLLDLHDALEKLAAHDPVKARLVELRYFTGMTLPEAAAVLGISPSTADRAWRYARAWLYAAMEADENPTAD